jgi:hypothetical protein
MKPEIDKETFQAEMARYRELLALIKHIAKEAKDAAEILKYTRQPESERALRSIRGNVVIAMEKGADKHFLPWVLNRIDGVLPPEEETAEAK